MSDELPRAHLRVRDAAGRAERLGAVARHGVRRAVPIVRTIVATVGVLALLVMLGILSAVTSPRHTRPDMPRLQLPRVDTMQYDRQLQEMLKSYPIYLPPIAPITLQHETP